MITFFLYIGFVVVNCMIAESKKRDVFLVFIFSILLTPILPFFYLLAVGDKYK